MFWDHQANRTVLAIGAHPDDIELGCGGTLLMLVNQGWKVYTAICSTGAIKDPKNIRLNEFKQANALIGVEKLFVLNKKDGDILHNADLVKDLGQIIQEVKPSTIFTHSFSDHHQDHVNVSRATISACRRQRINLILYPNLSSICQSEFNFYVDISLYLNKKNKLLAVYNSQKTSWYMEPSFIKKCASHVGDLTGCKFAERFLIYSSFH